jgi:hypothetical protein
MDAETVKRYRDQASADLQRRAEAGRTDADQLDLRDMRIFNLCDALLDALGE